MATPTLIGMPEPPSNPETPTEMPGTPNSTTTSMSALSTTAIKDGHRGTSYPHTGLGHHHNPSSNTLEAERADRISRLAGLERVSTVRSSSNQVAGGGGTTNTVAGGGQIPGYFDQNGNPVYTTKMSTVGSASATGSAGGRTTTWASGSAKGMTEADDDEMSMDNNYRDIDDRDRFSASAMDEDMDQDGMSDDTSLVGFGEGAGSTVSGPTYNRREATGRSALAAQLQRDGASNTPGTPLSDRITATTEAQKKDSRIVDAGTDEASSGYMDTAYRGDGIPRRSSGTEAAERIMRDRLDEGENRKPTLGTPEEAGIGKFYFEEKK